MSTPDYPALLDGLEQEDELAGPAALASNVAHHYDRNAGALMRSGNLDVLKGLLKLVGDDRKVRRPDPPSLPIQGGYGKAFGAVTVGDKARFILERMLPPLALREALVKGPAWVDAQQKRLAWDDKARRFQLR